MIQDTLEMNDDVVDDGKSTSNLLMVVASAGIVNKSKSPDCSFDEHLNHPIQAISWESNGSSKTHTNTTMPSSTASSCISDTDLSVDHLEDQISPIQAQEADNAGNLTNNDFTDDLDDTVKYCNNNSVKRFFPVDGAVVRFTDGITTNVQISPLGHGVMLDEVQMQEYIRQLECDLSAEKAMRRKKDRSIVKLAKQLKFCTNESHLKERQIINMAKTINELEQVLHNHHRELAIDQEKIRNVCRQSEERLEEYETLVQALRKQLFDLHLELDNYRLIIHQMKHNNISTNDDNVTDCSKTIGTSSNATNDAESIFVSELTKHRGWTAVVAAVSITVAGIVLHKCKGINSR